MSRVHIFLLILTHTYDVIKYDKSYICTNKKCGSPEVDVDRMYSDKKIARTCKQTVQMCTCESFVPNSE
jgi:hypothetical protein